MADEDLSPQPFERRRNLSNRNFEKYGSRRRPSTASNASSSFDSPSLPHQESFDSSAATDSSSLQISYSVNSDTENGFREKSLRKLRLPTQGFDRASVGTEQTPPQTPDPALLDVKQKVIRFEGLKPTNNFLFRFSRQQKARSLEQQQQKPKSPLPSYVASTFREFPHDEEDNGAEESSSDQPSLSSARNSSIFNASIDEESTAQTEDDVDNFSDYEEEEGEVAEIAEEALDATSIGDIGDADSSKVGRSISVEATNSVAIAAATGADIHSNDIPQIIIMDGSKTVGRDFKRNYSLKPRPKTQIIATNNSRLAGKFRSHYEEQDADDYEEAELRHKCDINVNNILEELLKTEEKYVQELLNGIENYGTIFERKDLPVGLRGKKYDLFGNIEQIAEFHRDEFLPMLHRNRRDLKRMFDEFQAFIDQNCFYGYVIFTMNKQNSLKLCDAYRPYFKLIQSELNDKLGINSFLVQPIQRMARYPLLLLEFIKKMFNNQEMKPILDSCCRLEKKVRTLLTTTNESEIINDIVNCHEFNVRLQGRFRKVDTFKVYDYTLKRGYNAKVFIFDKCIIYTEIKGKSLLFHGRYPCEHVGFTSKNKSFTLYYERRKQQECDFTGEPALVEHWLELIRDMINSFVREEREKLHERYTRDNDHLHRKPPSLSLYRDSNRFSSDSGIGNIWVMPKPENDEFVANRTTWYAVT